jgi:nucleolar protein 12
MESAGVSSSLASLFDPSVQEKFKRVISTADVEAAERRKRRREEAKEVEAKERRSQKKPKHKNLKPVEMKANDTVAIEGSSSEAIPNAGDDSHSDKYRDRCTLFVGNVPISYDTKKLAHEFKVFGEIDSIRLRSVPFEGVAVDDKGNQKLVRKVAINQGKIGGQKGSCNAYIVFKNEDSVSKAIASKLKVLGDRHIRLDRTKPTLFDPKLTVFLGGLPFYTDEEELQNHFAAVLPGGHDDIVSIRLVRDPETLVGKGIGYMLLSNLDAVMKALGLNDKKFKHREIRVSTCGKRTKRTAASAKPVKVAPPVDASGEVPVVASLPSSSSSSLPVAEPKRPKKEKNRDASGAIRRLQSKKEMKAIQRSKSSGPHNKAKVNKKAKKLGGVIKRALKDSKPKKNSKSI